MAWWNRSRVELARLQAQDKVQERELRRRKVAALEEIATSLKVISNRLQILDTGVFTELVKGIKGTNDAVRNTVAVGGDIKQQVSDTRQYLQEIGDALK